MGEAATDAFEEGTGIQLGEFVPPSSGETSESEREHRAWPSVSPEKTLAVARRSWVLLSKSRR